LLVRAAERVRALSIQAALGASRAQIGGQLLLEAILISVMGGAAGLFLAWLGVDAIQTQLAAEHWGFHWMDMAIDGRVLAFTSILVVGTALVSGMLPAVRVLKVDVQQVLKEESAGSSVGGGSAWGRAFVTIQLALSCAALVAAGLTGRAMSASRDFAQSLPTDEILLAMVPACGGRRHVEKRPRARADGASGGAAQCIGSGTRARGSRILRTIRDLGVRRHARRACLGSRARRLERSHARLLSVDLVLLAGRGFASEDQAGTAPVAIVNESFVTRFSPDQAILGRTIRVGARPDSAVWHTVVGVVSDARVGAGERIRHDRVYLPLPQVKTESALLLLRATADVATVASTLRQAVSDVDPRLAISSVRTLEDGHAYMTRVPRAMGALAVGGGSAGLLVAAVGLYGLLAFRVRRQRHELGVRLALGADGARLARDTLAFALRQLVPAIVVGLTLAWIAAPSIGVMLLGLDPRGASTYAGVAVAFLVVGLLAAGIPAWRASLTEPAQVLRGE